MLSITASDLVHSGDDVTTALSPAAVAKGNQHSARGGKNPEQPATLAEAGIDKNLAKRARTLAAVPGEKFEKLLGEKRQREDWRTVLHPVGNATEAGGITRERIESAAIRFAEQLATQNEALALQIETLVRRVAAALDEAKMWKERALAAGWTEEHADA